VPKNSSGTFLNGHCRRSFSSDIASFREPLDIPEPVLKANPGLRIIVSQEGKEARSEALQAVFL